MNLRILSDGFMISARKLTAAIILFVSTFVSLSLFHSYLLIDKFSTLAVDTSWYSLQVGLFYGSLALLAIIGSMISEKVDRRKLLWFGIGFGVLSTASYALLGGLLLTLLSSALVGASIGVLFPSCYALLVDYTSSADRARVFGTAFLVSFITLVLIVVVFMLLPMELTEKILISMAIRLGGFSALLLDPCKREKGKTESWIAILTRRDFLFYLVPWLMFVLSDGLTKFLNIEVQYVGYVLEQMCVLITAVIAGVVADWFGRKPPLIIGLVMLGLSYVVMTTTPNELSWLLIFATQGIAWGLIVISYSAVLGDLAKSGSKEKYFAVGGIMNIFMVTMIFLVLKTLFNPDISPSVLYPIVSVMLFGSIIPVLFAKETLSGKRRQAKKMKEHLDKVGRLVQEAKKSQ